jgi:phosphate-selective porin OprO/OprP
MTVRFGKGLTPPLYEYYGFTPALEPVITNSPLFQLAGKRQLGVMFLGSLFNNRFQYWSGVTNAGTSFWYAMNRNMEYNGAFDITPFKRKENPNPLLEGMGFGIGVSAGDNQFALKQSNISFLNGAGEPNTNGAWVTSSGVPFAVYNPNVVANGMRTRWSPHFYWYGRFSVLAEMINNSRVLSDGTNTARSTQWGWYVNLSYWLTGERDFAGNGFQGYSTIVPNNPLHVAKRQYGPGAWQVAAQFAELNIGRGDFDHGFINPTLYTNRLDQLMVGLNWWPNKYTRMSFDWVWTYLNNPIPINGPNPVGTFNTFWVRAAMFF